MKNTKFVVFSLMALVLSACGQHSNNQGGGSSSYQNSQDPDANITLIDPTNTSMLTENCKKYIDDMRAYQATVEDPYKYHEITLNIEDSAKGYLDTGSVNGTNGVVGQIPNRSDRSEGVELKFNVKEGFTADEYKVLVSDNAEFANAKEYEPTNNAVIARNLMVNKQYYWKVQAGNEESAVFSFTTGDYPRWITARSLTGEEGGRGIYNVRDLGGYMTSSGKRVKQGLVFRGGEITTMSNSGHYNTITEFSKKIFRGDMGMVGGVELDLRGPSDIRDSYTACGFAVDGDIEYAQYALKSYEQTFTQTRSMVAPIFELLKNANNKHVYFHCHGGADRTGTIGFLLNGLLGVSYEDLVIDFELTSYSSIDNEHIRNHLEGHQHSYDRWPALINQLKTDTTGSYVYDPESSLKDNIEEFLVKACSVPQATIDTIRDIMLED